MSRNERTMQIVKGVIALVIGVVYILNPTAGLVELLPDVMPFAGNLDEAAATALAIYGLRELRGTPKKTIDA